MQKNKIIKQDWVSLRSNKFLVFLQTFKKQKFLTVCQYFLIWLRVISRNEDFLNEGNR